jgi:hypothetical protein
MKEIINVTDKVVKQLFRLNTENRRVYEFKPGVRTIEPNNRPSEQQWINEFRFGLAHGKTIVYFG